MAILISSFEISTWWMLITYFPARFNISAEMYSNTATKNSDTVLSNLYCRTSYKFQNKNQNQNKIKQKNCMKICWTLRTFWSKFWIWLSGKTTFFFFDLSIVSRASVNAHLSIGVGNVLATRSSMSWKSINLYSF